MEMVGSCWVKFHKRREGKIGWRWTVCGGLKPTKRRKRRWIMFWKKRLDNSRYQIISIKEIGEQIWQKERVLFQLNVRRKERSVAR